MELTFCPIFVVPKQELESHRFNRVKHKEIILDTKLKNIILVLL